MTGYYGRWSALGLATVCLNLLGCATLQFPWEKSVPHASARNPVVQVVCLWEPAQGKDPDGKTCRGFAGQIIFMGNKGGTAVTVDGKVRVKEFDQFSGQADESEPFHQFDFDEKAWNVHLLNGSLGPTYNVFIPYMRKGSHDAHCELVVEYTPSDGGAMISSTVASLYLRGKPTAKEAAAAKATEGLIPHTPMEVTDRGARTTTIPLDGRGAAKETPPRDAMAARLERMERIMQEFAAQQAQPRPRTVEPEAAAAPVASGHRFALDGSRASRSNIVQTAAAEVAAERQAEAAASPATSRRHLLSAHPLAMEDHAPPANPSVNVAQRPAARHPLADEPAFAKNSPPQFRNTPPATLVVPEELTDAPLWSRDDNAVGRATVSEELDGKTTQVQ